MGVLDHVIQGVQVWQMELALQGHEARARNALGQVPSAREGDYLVSDVVHHQRRARDLGQGVGDVGGYIASR